VTRVLIVDDETSILNLLKTVLEASSFEVETAKSATEAKSRLRQTKFDLVLTDMRMETPIAGYDVVRAAQQLNPRPAVAILTAFPIPSSDWRSSGADALLVKGTNIMDLPQKLQSLLKLRPQREEKSDPGKSARSG
jgi:CheY-like chemotaxis protein